MINWMCECPVWESLDIFRKINQTYASVTLFLTSFWRYFTDLSRASSWISLCFNVSFVWFLNVSVQSLFYIVYIFIFFIFFILYIYIYFLYFLYCIYYIYILYRWQGSGFTHLFTVFILTFVLTLTAPVQLVNIVYV